MPELQRRSPLGREARIVNMTELGKALDAVERSAGESDGGVQLESGGHRAESELWCWRGCGARISSPWCWSSFRTTPRIMPTSCCPPRRSWNIPISIWLTGITTCSLPGPRCRRRAKPSRTWKCSGCWPSAWVSTNACFADSEDDMIRTLLDSGHPFLQGITLERLDREHSVRLNVAPDSEPFLPFAQGGFGTPSGKCEFGAEALRLSAAHRIAARRAGIARALSAGTDFRQEPRQYELHLRQRALGGAADGHFIPAR